MNGKASGSIPGKSRVEHLGGEKNIKRYTGVKRRHSLVRNKNHSQSSSELRTQERWVSIVKMESDRQDRQIEEFSLIKKRKCLEKHCFSEWSLQTGWDKLEKTKARLLLGKYSKH